MTGVSLLEEDVPVNSESMRAVKTNTHLTLDNDLHQEERSELMPYSGDLVQDLQATRATVAPLLHLSVSADRAGGGGAASRQVTERRGRDSTGLIITLCLIEPLGVINAAAESRIP